jgi:hypothetical protein
LPAHLRRLALAAALGLLLAGAPFTPSQAGVLRYCDAPAALSAPQQDRLLRFAAAVKAELETSGQSLALIARSGLDLDRFGQRYSHAGISLRANPNAPWSVRQLYYDCDLRQPRLFDQGIAGFLLGGADPAIGHVALLLLPAEAAAPLEREALDKRSALRLLGRSYSANAYPFSPRHQNCNQWVAELLAVAWGGLAEHTGDDTGTGAGAAAHDDGDRLRQAAQGWLQAQGYQPTPFELGNPLLMGLAGLLPWLHRDDHPADDLALARFQVSMPASIEAFVRRRLPGAQRLEICHSAGRVVVHRGWAPLAEGCQPGPDDTVTALD